MLETHSFKATALQFHGVLGLFECSETLPHKFSPHIYAFPWLRTFTQATTTRFLVTSEPVFFLALGLCFLSESSNKWTVAPSTVPGNMVKIKGTTVGGGADAPKVKLLAPALLCRLEKKKKILSSTGGNLRINDADTSASHAAARHRWRGAHTGDTDTGRRFAPTSFHLSTAICCGDVLVFSNK